MGQEVWGGVAFVGGVVGVGAMAVRGFIFPLSFPFFGAGPGGTLSAEVLGAASGAGSSDQEPGISWTLSPSHGVSAALLQIEMGSVGGWPGGGAPVEQVAPRAAESEPIKMITTWHILGVEASFSEAAWK